MPGRPIEKAIRAIEVICTSFNVNSLYFKSVIKIGSDNIIRPSIVGKEIEIAKDQLRQEGKPEDMLDNIAKGKIKRFFKDNTLVNQAYIKDVKISVSEYVKSEDSDLVVTGFERVALG